MNTTKNNRKLSLSTTQIIALGFLIAIAAGSVLLMLPISSANNTYTSFIDALFTATTSVCVTGLTVVNTFEHWSNFGQLIILLLIQFGGLGIVTFTTSLLLLLRRKVTLKDRLLLQDAFNLKSMTGLVKFAKKVVMGTITVEAAGAFFYCFTFIPEFGFGKGLWISVFTAVSAFCNAGMDIIGYDSLMPYITNINVNFTTMLLIIMGGIGFIVWFDVINVIKSIKRKETPKHAFFNRLSLHSKIVLTATAILIIFGTFIIFILECTNESTIGFLSFPKKVMASLFEAVTTRTAGFLTFSQKNMRTPTALFCIIFMFIGGSPVGTAGGVKTSTIALIIVSAMSAIRGNEYGIAFSRRLPNRTMRKALAVTLISLLFCFSGIILLLVYNDGDLLDIMFETTSAIATVGLSRNYTDTLNPAGKIIIIVCMYAGRIGPMTLPILFSLKKSKYGLATFPREDITVG